MKFWFFLKDEVGIYSNMKPAQISSKLSLEYTIIFLITGFPYSLLANFL
jgi:hypothetical protein